VSAGHYADRVATTIVLARHGETDWNVERRVQGHTDRPLTDDGREQAVALANQLEGERLDAVYASDLSRAVETARPAAERRGLQVVTMPELREKRFGTWEGLTDDEVLERYPDARRGHWGDGETTEDVAARVVDALRRIADRHPDGRVLVVTHGGPLRAVLRACATGADRAIANCHVARIEVVAGGIRSVD
jgi:broad specificity phosphatase PhoE